MPHQLGGILISCDDIIKIGKRLIPEADEGVIPGFVLNKLAFFDVAFHSNGRYTLIILDWSPSLSEPIHENPEKGPKVREWIEKNSGGAITGSSLKFVTVTAEGHQPWWRWRRCDLHFFVDLLVVGMIILGFVYVGFCS